MIDKKRMLSFVNLRHVKPMMDWEDIKETEIYHLPPLIYNKRMDFIVVEKKENSMRIKKLGDEYSQTLFRTDVTARFIIKKQKMYG